MLMQALQAGDSEHRASFHGGDTVGLFVTLIFLGCFVCALNFSKGCTKWQQPFVIMTLLNVWVDPINSSLSSPSLKAFICWGKGREWVWISLAFLQGKGRLELEMILQTSSRRQRVPSLANLFDRTSLNAFMFMFWLFNVLPSLF